MKRLVVITIFSLFFIGCGYKPSSTYTKKSINQNVYVGIEVNPKEPTNIPFIKDSMIEAVVSRFHSRVVDKNSADTVINIELKNVSFTPLTYDSNGYVTAYRAVTTLVFKYGKPNEPQNLFYASGEYDFNIEPNSVISDSNRQDAIKNASAKAIDSFISYLSSKGALIK